MSLNLTTAARWFAPVFARRAAQPATQPVIRPAVSTPARREPAAATPSANVRVAQVVRQGPLDTFIACLDDAIANHHRDWVEPLANAAAGAIYVLKSVTVQINAGNLPLLEAASTIKPALLKRVFEDRLTRSAGRMHYDKSRFYGVVFRNGVEIRPADGDVVRVLRAHGGERMEIAIVFHGDLDYREPEESVIPVKSTDATAALRQAAEPLVQANPAQGETNLRSLATLLNSGGASDVGETQLSGAAPAAQARGKALLRIVTASGEETRHTLGELGEAGIEIGRAPEGPGGIPVAADATRVSRRHLRITGWGHDSGVFVENLALTRGGVYLDGQRQDANFIWRFAEPSRPDDGWLTLGAAAEIDGAVRLRLERV